MKYGAAHQRARRAGLAFAYGSPCVRCGVTMVEGEALHLDHRDDGRGYLGFSHARCNTSAGARLGNLRRNGAKFMNDEVAVGVDASQDRKHVSVARCGEQDRKGRQILVVNFGPYLAGATDLVGTVTGMAPVAVGVDNNGPVRHLVDDLEDAYLGVVCPSVPELLDAQADFFAKVDRRELFITGGRELDAAVQHARMRVGESAPRLSRTGPNDMGPLFAAVLALWAWGNRPQTPSVSWI